MGATGDDDHTDVLVNEDSESDPDADPDSTGGLVPRPYHEDAA